MQQRLSQQNIITLKTSKQCESQPFNMWIPFQHKQTNKTLEFQKHKTNYKNINKNKKKTEKTALPCYE